MADPIPLESPGGYLTHLFPEYQLMQLPASGMIGPIFMYGAIFAIFYFILIRPQQKQRKHHEALVKAVKKGDEIVTTGGLVGEVIHIRETPVSEGTASNSAEDRITIKSGESRLVIERGRIARVIRAPGSPVEGVTILGIRVLGDPVLRKAAEPVTEVTDETRALISNMFDTMHAAEGIGLAAPQVGRSERVAVVEVDGAKYALVNPEIVERGGNARAEEGCLSIPEIFGEVDRAARIVVRALNESGEPVEVEGTELLARCLQHEIDHLDGKLFIDYLSVLKRRSAMSKWERQKGDYPGFIRRVVLEPRGPDHSEGEL